MNREPLSESAAGAARYPWETPDRSTWPDLNYLLTEAARARYVLAAHYVRECEHVVEIGGFKTPVTGFLTRIPRSVLVVDPKIEAFHADTLRGRPCEVRHVRARFQEHDFRLAPGSTGLVILGCSIKYFSEEPAVREAEWSKLAGLMEGARVTVLEYPLGWELGADNVETLTSRVAVRRRLSIDLDIGDNPGIDTPYHRRRFLVLEPAASR